MSCPANCLDRKITALEAVDRSGSPHFHDIDCPFCTTGYRGRLSIAPRQYLSPQAVALVYPALQDIIGCFPQREGQIDSVLAHEVWREISKAQHKPKPLPDESLILSRPNGHLPKYLLHEDVRYDSYTNLTDATRLPASVLSKYAGDPTVRTIYVRTFRGALKPYLCQEDVFAAVGKKVKR